MKIFKTLFFSLLVAASPFSAAANEPSGASLAFTSHDAIVTQAREDMNAGKFKEAEASLIAVDPNANGEQSRARAELLEIIRRTRYEYSLTPEQLVVKVQKAIPGATAKDVSHWADETDIRFRMIDGQKFYFRREPQNIFLYSKEAIRRRASAGNAPYKGNWKLDDYLKKIIAQAERTGQTEVLPVKHTVTHILTINSNAPGIKEGALVRVWLPFPQEYRQQKNVKLLSASPGQKLIAPSAIEGNPVTGGAQRTVYFEEKVIDPAKPLQFSETFEYTSYAYYPKLDVKKVQPLPADWNGAEIGERPPHIVFTDAMLVQVANIIGQETNALVKARKIFHWVSAHVPWNAEDEYCIIPSFAEKGFNARRGDCGVQNTVFVTLCRIAGIPARWQSGYETKPLIGWGMHDWSEIYIPPWGWIPTDASYGVQKSSNPKVADFFCGHQDSYRLIINLDWGRDLFPPKESIRSEPADFQRGEVEIDGKNLYYDQWSTETKLVRDPGPNPPEEPKK